MSRVYIFDTTLRDGEQSPGCSMTVPEKLQHGAQAGGSRRRHPGSRIPDRVGRRFRGRGRRQPRVSLGPGGRAGALLHAATWNGPPQSLQHARRPRIHTFIATSDIHLKYKLKKTQQQVLDEAVAAVELARRHVDDVEFSAEDGARTDPDFLEKISKAVVAAGARTVNIPDTVGYSAPEEYGALIGRIAKALGDCAIVSVHCHDDLGLAVANSLAAVEAGARQIECTINGIGERAGNCSLEEIVMVLKTRPDSLPLPHRHPHRASVLGEPVAEFDHHLRAATEQGDRGPQRVRARGGHPPGRLSEGKDRPTKSSTRESVGVPEGKLVLGKHSGRHALKQRARGSGFRTHARGTGLVYDRFTAVADTQEGSDGTRRS